MKELTNYQRVSNYLVKVFKAVNADYFNNELEVPTITIQSTVGAYGHVTTSKVWSNGEKATYELKVAENMGHLVIGKHDTYGWTITAPSEDTIDFCIANGFEDIQIGRTTGYALIGVSGGKSGNGNGTAVPRTKKPSSTRKYICPCCGNSFRATKSLNVMCMDCNEQFIVAE